LTKKKWIGLFAILFAILAADSLWWEPASFVVHRETLVLPNWTVPLRVAALSDLHIGSNHVGLDKLRYIVETTNAEKPDIVVIMGDFVNSPTVVTPEKIAAELMNLNAPTYAVLGNHDRWFDGPRVEAALTAVGIKVLENQATRIEHDSHPYWLGGIADLWTASPDIPGTLAQTNRQEPVILFTHNPDVFPDVPARVGLMIAGHTHGGQVEFPWFGTPVTVSMYRKGHIVEGGRHLFVTTGVGTSIAPIRFRVTPELVMLSLSGSR
jgi:predicted MPP superfamily phosphohydrolase